MPNSVSYRSMICLYHCNGKDRHKTVKTNTTLNVISVVIQCPFSHKVWKSAANNYTENQACYYKAYNTYLFNKIISLPLQNRLYRLMFFLYRCKIAYYLSHTGKDKIVFLLWSLKVLINNMLLGYCPLMLTIYPIYIHNI